MYLPGISFANFEEHVTLAGLSERTALDVAREASRFARWYTGEIEHFQWQAVTPTVLRSYLAFRMRTHAEGKDTPRRKSTVRRQLMNLRTWFRWLHDTGHIPANPAADVKGPKLEFLLMPVLSDADVLRILKAASTYSKHPRLRARDYAIMVTLAYTGVRREELLRVRREDLVRGDTAAFRGKAGYHREVGIPSVIFEAYREYDRLRNDTGGYAWAQQSGDPLNLNGLSILVRRIGQSAGLSRLGTHALRRWFFNRLALNGWQWFELQAIGGWRTPQAAWRYIGNAARVRAVTRHQAITESDIVLVG